MFKINDREIVEYTNELERFSATAVPYATRNTLNQAAFDTRRRSQDNLREKMILRNTFSARSIQVEKVSTLAVRMQESRVGSIAAYLKDQEEGETRYKTGKEGVPLLTSYGAGQGMGVSPRTRLATRPNRLANIKLSKRNRRGKTRKQRNAISIHQAAASGQKFVFLDLGKRKGLFRVVGGKRNPQIRMVYDLSRTSVRIPKNPWFEPAIEETLRQLPAIHLRSLEFQARRLRLFR